VDTVPESERILASGTEFARALREEVWIP